MAESVRVDDTFKTLDGTLMNGLLKAVLPVSIRTSAGSLVPKGEKLYRIIEGKLFDYEEPTQPARIPVTEISGTATSMILYLRLNGSKDWVKWGSVATPDTDDVIELTDYVVQ